MGDPVVSLNLVVIRLAWIDGIGARILMPIFVHRPRFTIRRLMAVVAIVAILLTAGKMLMTWRLRSLKAGEYAAEAQSWADDASKVERMMVKPRSQSDPASRQRLAGLGEVARNYRDHERSNRELASKYARAAARPWVPIEPDPPEP